MTPSQTAHPTEGEATKLRALFAAIPAGMRPHWEVHEDESTGIVEIRTVLDGDVDGDTGRHLIVGGNLIAIMADALGQEALAAFIVALVNAAPGLLSVARPQGEEAIGPLAVDRVTCEGCPAFKSEWWKDHLDNDETDSGTRAHCTAADKHITEYWSPKGAPPTWCPALSNQGKPSS